MTTSGNLIPMIMTDLEALAKEFSMTQFGVCKLERPLTMDFYYYWLESEKFASMTYLKTHAPQKENPQLLSSNARSALVFSKSYLPHPKPLPESPLRIALYAQGHDYHHWFKQELTAICQKLKEKYPQDEFLPLTDSAPVLERDLAKKAGLGWFGKNTCLLDRQHGSLFFIGEIYTSLDLGTASPLPSLDFCGTCSKCLEICPTNALESPRMLNANKCISYLTIEAKVAPPPELREKMGDWFFGCDLCQTICPWNQKKFNQSLTTSLKKSLSHEQRQTLIIELDLILSLSGKKLSKRFASSPLLRAGSFGLRRNAILVAANHDLKELLPQIESWIADPRLGELAIWAKEKLIHS